MARKLHQVRKTLLIVGGGDSEEAFLKHLRDLYCSGGTGVAVTIRNAHGKGPENVIDYAAKLTRIFSYDARAVLLDTDILWTEKLKKEARRFKIDMVGSIPCFEGLLISILGKQPAEKCADCKKAIQKLLNIDLTERRNYAEHFPKTLLDSARTRIGELDQLLKRFEGR